MTFATKVERKRIVDQIVFVFDKTNNPFSKNLLIFFALFFYLFLPPLEAPLRLATTHQINLVVLSEDKPHKIFSLSSGLNLLCH